MFGKILVANRGEIACRVIRTARRLGIATVAVYSEADRNALHVELADEAVPIGPAAASESYLRIEAIVDACRRTGAEAVHPGYGFLSENPAFARALAAADIVFIGPPPAAMEAMGDKIEAKKFAARAGVRTVPGHPGVISDPVKAVQVAAEIGYPVMIKASAGGGGKGMRVARSESEAREGFERARSEARSAFGDDRVFLEKFIEEPRHIEIQILADSHGNVVHLGERECSIQRRNQKVVEEAPSPFLDEGSRAEMGAMAIALAKAVGYQSAGTIEFIADRDRAFYFLEMNTRLQVEHPVTELVTGIDIVEAMIRIAAGAELGFSQADIRSSGWAVEARIYAEDPARGFLPSVGRLTRYRPPLSSRGERNLDADHPRQGPSFAAARPFPSQEGRGVARETSVRIDSGVVEGSEISVFYDPMIAKLCTHALDRAAAIEAMADALDRFEIEGVRHNVPFLATLMAHPRWREGRLSTGFIAEEFSEGLAGAPASGADETILAAIATSAGLLEQARLAGLGGEKAGPVPPRDLVLAIGRRHLPISVHVLEKGSPARLLFGIGNAPPLEVRTDWRPGERIWRGAVDGVDVLAQVGRRGHRLRVKRRGAARWAALMSRAAAELEALMPEMAEGEASQSLRCPMPGLVLSIAVSEGQKVEAGEPLAVVEAMKMENVLRAERPATVARVLAKPGDSLAVDDIIMEFR